MKKIQEVLKALGESGCLMLDYCFCAKITEWTLIESFNKLVLNRAIRDDCYVLDANKMLSLLGSNKKVKKVDIKDVPKGKPYIIPYSTDSNTHFIVEVDGKPVYDTLSNSYCYRYGKPSNIVRIVE